MQLGPDHDTERYTARPIVESIIHYSSAIKVETKDYAKKAASLYAYFNMLKTWMAEEEYRNIAQWVDAKKKQIAQDFEGLSLTLPTENEQAALAVRLAKKHLNLKVAQCSNEEKDIIKKLNIDNSLDTLDENAKKLGFNLEETPAPHAPNQLYIDMVRMIGAELIPFMLQGDEEYQAFQQKQLSLRKNWTILDVIQESSGKLRTDKEGRPIIHFNYEVEEDGRIKVKFHSPDPELNQFLQKMAPVDHAAIMTLYDKRAEALHQFLNKSQSKKSKEQQPSIVPPVKRNRGLPGKLSAIPTSKIANLQEAGKTKRQD